MRLCLGVSLESDKTAMSTTRTTNLSEFVKITREANPYCILPDNLDTPVWRYMDLEKFHSLLKESALYLCRADRLEERFEGTYSRRQIMEMEKWFRAIGKDHLIEAEKERRRKDRLNTYINCWCMGECDLDLMWKRYIRKPPGISIMSSVKRLKDICDRALECWPLDISAIAYFKHVEGENINYLGTPATFIYKDVHFKLDNELRIIHYPSYSEPTPTHVFLKIDLKDLIEKVVLQPMAKESDMACVMGMLRNAELDEIPVEHSRADGEIIV